MASGALEAGAAAGAWDVRRGLRVLQVIDADPLAYPPTINAARVLAASGADVLCLGGVRRSNPMLTLPRGARVEYAALGAAGRGPPKLGWALGRLRFREAVVQASHRLRPHLIIAYDSSAGWAVLPLLQNTRTPVVLHVHDNENTDGQSWRSLRSWQWAAVRRNMHRFDRRVVPDAARAAHLRDAWHVLSAFDVVANAPPRRVPCRNDLLRNLLQIAFGEPLAVVIGNSGLLVRMARGIARTHARWHLVVIGCENQRGVDAMLQEGRTLGIEQRVHVLPHTSYDTVRDWLPGCDVGLALHPTGSRTVNWRAIGSGSVKVMEYMAAGLPSIVCSREAFQELARETEALEVLVSEDEHGIRHALDALEPGTQHWHERSRAAVRAHLSRFNMAAQLLPLLAKLGLATSTPPASKDPAER